MIKNQQELMFVEPTNLFFKLLKLNNVTFKDIKKAHLKVDKTACFIRKHSHTEQTIDEIERHYKDIFLYEIRRWLGKNFKLNFEPSLYDFANCFKLSFHQNVYLVKKDVQAGNIIGVNIKPRPDLLKWFKTNTNLDSNYHAKITLSSLQQNSTIVLNWQDDLEQTHDFVMSYFTKFAEFENNRLSLSCFPIIKSFDDFKRFFTISIHQYIKFLEPEFKAVIAN